MQLCDYHQSDLPAPTQFCAAGHSRYFNSVRICAQARIRMVVTVATMVVVVVAGLPTVRPDYCLSGPDMFVSSGA